MTYIKQALLYVSLVLFPVSIAAENQVVGGQWRGLNNGDASISIQDSEAQDLENVDVTDSGFGIKKRAGTTQFKTIGVSTWGVRGGHTFVDASGISNIVHSNDRKAYKSSLGGAYSAFITTDAAGSYYDFADSLGYLYRATNNRDQFIRYDGTTLTYYPSNPRGDQVEVLPDRLAISGVSGSPNRVYFSEVADFTSFTVGSEETDPFTEDFGLTGNTIKAIKWTDDELLVWTKTNLYSWVGSNQYDGDIREISTTIGTLQPNSVIRDLGITYWQGQDGHFYAYDGNGIAWISRSIAGSVANFAGGGEVRNWEQTSQSDFVAGTVGSSLSTSLSVGDVLFTTGTLIDDFSDGVYTSTPVWTPVATAVTTGFAASGGLVISGRAHINAGGSNPAGLYTSVIQSTGIWKMRIYPDTGALGTSNIKISTGIPSSANPDTSNSYTILVDDVNDTIGLWRAGTHVSSFSVTIPQLTWFALEISRSASGVFTISKDGVFVGQATDTTYTGFNYLTLGQVGSAVLDLTLFDDVYTIPNTGRIQSQTFNIGTAITAWNTFNVTHGITGGSISYALYTDTNSSITITDATTFVSSQSISPSAIPSVGTNTWVTWSADFSRTVSTQNPTLSDITINWFDGTQAHTWAFVDKNHRIGWSVLEGTGTVTNKTYIYDPRFDTWLKYSLPFDAPVNSNGTIYFGDPDGGTVYTWPVGNTDNGSAITAYWKSKDFIGSDPYVEKDYTSLSLIADAQPGSNLDVTYTINTSSSISYNISLADSNGNGFIRNNYSLPSGKFGTFFNFNFGNDDADAPFEVYTVRYDYRPRPWRVLP